MSTRHNARRAVIQALYQWDITQQDASEIEASFKQIHDMQNIDRRYLKRALRDIPENDEILLSMIEPFLDRSIDTLDPVERAILRLGAYELRFCPDVPKKVVINEMVELAKVFGSEHSYKFINGVIDKLARHERQAGK